MPEVSSYDDLTAAQLVANGFQVLGDSGGSTKNAQLAELRKALSVLDETIQTGTTYTVQASDQDTVVKLSNSAPKTVTIPSSAGFLYGCPILVRNTGSGILNFAVTSGVEFKASSLTLELYETAVLIPQAGNVWDGYVPGSGGSSSLVTLNAPTGLTATVNSSTQITLSWSDNNTSPNESNVLIQSSTNGTSFSNLITLAANTTSYPATGLTPGTLYYFRVINKGNGTTTADSTYAQTTATTSTAGYLETINWLSYHDPELNIDTEVSGSDIFINSIDDQKAVGSINPRLRQTDTTKRPKLIEAAINGHDVVDISGGKFLKIDGFRVTPTKPFSVLYLGYFINFSAQGSAGYLVETANDHNSGHWFGADNQKFVMYSTTQLLSPSNLTAATPYVFYCVFYGDATNDQMYINDSLTPVAVGDVGGIALSVPGNIAMGDLTQSGLSPNGRIGRLFTYSGVLTDAERIGAMNELKTFYGIS